MSLGIIVKGSEGIVLAADSRLTLGAQIMVPTPQAPQVMQPQQIFVNFDNATKLLSFGPPNQWIGAVTYGDAVIGTKPTDLRTAQSFLPEFEQSLPQKRLTVGEFSKKLSDFFLERWKDRGMPDPYPGQGMTFAVGGYDPEKAYGSIFTFNIPKQPNAQEQSANDFGIHLGGQAEHTIRLIQGYDPRILGIAKQVCNLTDEQVQGLQAALAQLMLSLPYAVLPLQDCIDMAVFLIHTTVAAQKLSVGIRGVGGVIDVAVITRRDPLRFIQRKELVVESAVLPKSR
jgi:hypothetical protein